MMMRVRILTCRRVVVAAAAAAAAERATQPSAFLDAQVLDLWDGAKAYVDAAEGRKSLGEVTSDDL